MRMYLIKEYIFPDGSVAEPQKMEKDIMFYGARQDPGWYVHIEDEIEKFSYDFVQTNREFFNDKPKEDEWKTLAHVYVEGNLKDGNLEAHLGYSDPQPKEIEKLDVGDFDWNLYNRDAMGMSGCEYNQHCKYISKFNEIIDHLNKLEKLWEKYNY